MPTALLQRLRTAGIQPSAQRLAVAESVLSATDHPSADQIWARARKRLPVLSRATVYNTLHLFVERGLLREHVLAEGRIVYDPNLDLHHHFIDEATGAIHDVPWDALRVQHVAAMPELEIREYQVVMRGRRRKRAARAARKR